MTIKIRNKPLIGKHAKEFFKSPEKYAEASLHDQINMTEFLGCLFKQWIAHLLCILTSERVLGTLLAVLNLSSLNKKGANRTMKVIRPL